MSKIEFEQDEVVAAAGRTWHKSEPAIIQQDGFPIASIVFTGESKDSFAGYGAIMDFRITDSQGKAYVAQIGKDMVAAAAEVQFPGDFTPAKVEEDAHNLLELLFGAVGKDAMSAIDEDLKAAEPESFSKRIRREVKALIAGTLPNHGVFKTGEGGKTTVAWRKKPGSTFLYIATATASDKDHYKEETGARIAYKRLIDGQSIALPLCGESSAEEFAINMFGRYEQDLCDSLGKEYSTKSKALRKEYADRGVEWLK